MDGANSNQPVAEQSQVVQEGHQPLTGHQNVTYITRSEQDSRRRSKKKKSNHRRRRKGATSSISSKIRHPVDQGVFSSILHGTAIFFCGLIAGVPLMLLLSIFFAIASVIRFVKTSCVFMCRRSVNGSSDNCNEATGFQFLSPQESLWYEDPYSIVHTVLMIEGQISWNRVKHLLYDRILDARLPHDDNVLRYPRFSQKVVQSRCGGQNVWCYASDFEINNHIFTATSTLRSKEDISNYVTKRATEPFSNKRPLWEVHVSNEDQTSGENHKTVLIIRTHSCLADGMTFIRILVNSLADGSHCCGVSTGPRPEGCFRLKPRFCETAHPLNIIRAVIIGPMKFFSWLFCLKNDRNLIRGPGYELSGRKVLLFSKELSLAKIRRIKQVTRSGYNDVLLSLISGSLRQYFRTHGVKSPSSIRANIAVDLRANVLKCNKVGRRTCSDMAMKMCMVNIRLPTDVEGAVPRLWHVHRSMESLKSSADAYVMYGALRYLYGLLPRSWATKMAKSIHSKQTVQVVNLPGPDTQLHLDSKRVESIIFWAPSLVHKVPLSISLMTYVDSVIMSVSADSSAVPDANCIFDEFAALVNVLAKLLANRRIPGEHRKKSYTAVTKHEEELVKVHPIEDLQKRLNDVQEELHDITDRLESSPPDGSAFQQLTSTQKILSERIEELKAQFSAVLEELHRRKSLADGSILTDSELDGALRRPRRRSLSTPIAWRQSNSSISSISSTSRPLTTLI